MTTTSTDKQPRKTRTALDRAKDDLGVATRRHKKAVDRSKKAAKEAEDALRDAETANREVIAFRRLVDDLTPKQPPTEGPATTTPTTTGATT